MQVRNYTDQSFKANCVVRGARTPFQAITKALEKGYLEVRTQAKVVPRGDDFVVIDGRTISQDPFSHERYLDIKAISEDESLPVIE